MPTIADPPNECLQESCDCPCTAVPQTFRRYPVFYIDQPDGSRDWFTDKLANVATFLASGCNTALTNPVTGGCLPGTGGPKSRPAHAKDYVTSNGEKRYYLGSGLNPPNSYIRVYPAG